MKTIKNVKGSFKDVVDLCHVCICNYKMAAVICIDKN